MVTVQHTRVIVNCIVPECSETVIAVFEPGEAQTYWHPGTPDWWYLETHGNDDEHEHISRPEEFQPICDFLAVQSFEDVYYFN